MKLKVKDSRRALVVMVLSIVWLEGCLSFPFIKSAKSLHEGQSKNVYTFQYWSFNIDEKSSSPSSSGSVSGSVADVSRYYLGAVDYRLGTRIPGLEVGLGVDLTGKLLGDLKYQWLGRDNPHAPASALDVEAQATLTGGLGLSTALLYTLPGDNVDFTVGSRIGHYERAVSKNAIDVPNYKNPLGWEPYVFNYFDVFVGFDLDIIKDTGLTIDGNYRGIFPQPVSYSVNSTSYQDTYAQMFTLSISLSRFGLLPFSSPFTQDRSSITSTENSSDSFEHRVKTGRKLINARLYKDALEEFQEAEKFGLLTKEVYLSKGFCYYSLGVLEKALTAYEKALELDPQDKKLKKTVEALRQKISNKNSEGIEMPGSPDHKNSTEKRSDGE